MKTIIRRKDNTSIYCRSINQHPTIFTENRKVIGFTIACTLITAGLFIIITTV